MKKLINFCIVVDEIFLLNINRLLPLQADKFQESLAQVKKRLNCSSNEKKRESGGCHQDSA